jgi:hypothetical protein
MTKQTSVSIMILLFVHGLHAQAVKLEQKGTIVQVPALVEEKSGRPSSIYLPTVFRLKMTEFNNPSILRPTKILNHCHFVWSYRQAITPRARQIRLQAWAISSTAFLRIPTIRLQL